MALQGLRVLEIAGLAPVPYCGLVLADFGADVVRVDRWPAAGGPADVLARGKRSLALDLKHPQGVNALLRLAEKADVLIEPFRPGVMERLGLGPDVLLRRNPRLIFARLTGFGQEGQYAQRAGHDINYIAVSGVLSLLGRRGESPLPPCNIMGDFAGGGMLCALGILLAVIERARSGKGQVVDAAMVDGSSYLSTFIHNHRHTGLWGNGRGSNLLDSGAPFYETYRTKDDKYVAVGAIEPQFYHWLLKARTHAEERTLQRGLELDSDESLPSQMDASQWPVLKRKFAERFLSRTRDEWTRVFDELDACVTPVLELSEVMQHQHNKDRGLLEENDTEGGRWEPRPAPRLSRTPAASVRAKASPVAGQQTRVVLREYGFDADDIDRLLEAGAAGESPAAGETHAKAAL